MNDTSEYGLRQLVAVNSLIVLLRYLDRKVFASFYVGGIYAAAGEKR